MQNTQLPFCLPNHLSPEQFFNEYWQKKPLLIKQGLTDLINMFEPDDILELAQDEEVTARLISQKNGQWSLKTSPFNEQDFSNLPTHWTVLVQNMEQWSPELANLWHAFDFIPQWQRDDIMVSYAPAGGSVGRHYDNYDVFLAQGYGSRRWQLGNYCDENTTFEAGQPIRIMSESDMGEIIFDEVLEAGDVLYVPTGLSHYGVAVDDCLTFSFGYRRPTPLQILDNLADVATHDDSLTIPLKIVQNYHTSGQIHQESLQDIKQQIINLLTSDKGDALLHQAICETVSKRQYDLMFAEDGLISPDELSEALQQGLTIQQDLAGRILYTDNPHQIYVNGELLNPTEFDKNALQLLTQLANGEQLHWQDIQNANVDIDIICDWLENGWILLND